MTLNRLTLCSIRRFSTLEVRLPKNNKLAWHHRLAISRTCRQNENSGREERDPRRVIRQKVPQKTGSRQADGHLLNSAAFLGTRGPQPQPQDAQHWLAKSYEYFFGPTAA